MKQVTQRLRDGRVEVLSVPSPVVSPGTVLVDVRASLLSAGTERTKVQTARKSLLGKARQRPDQVAQVIEKARTDGLRETVRTVRSRLDQPSVLGYSAAGVALAVGADVRGIAVGDRVAVGGADAVHAEVDRVPANLCVGLPDAVSFEEGCFACVGSIALHGVRQAGVTLGERVAVLGLGLVGQLTALLLRAAGCRVVGIDLDRASVESAHGLGGIDAGFARGEIGESIPPAAAGCDAVIVTAATPSNDPIELAPRLCRDRGRVVIVGDVGMALARAPFYEKEIDLRLSRSYGPGRYDRAYEENGQDYPIGYVRWT
jgi:threonine dehydrogenase-like Zn-dependent dehydrogenase